MEAAGKYGAVPCEEVVCPARSESVSVPSRPRRRNAAAVGLALLACGAIAAGAQYSGAVRSSTFAAQTDAVPLNCLARMKTELALQGFGFANFTDVQVDLLQLVAADFAGTAFGSMTGFVEIVGTWVYLSEGQCYLKYAFDINYLFSADEAVTEEEEGLALLDLVVEYLIKEILDGSIQYSFYESVTSLGATDVLFGAGTSEATILSYFDSPASEVLVDSETKVLWMKSCVAPTQQPTTAAPTTVAPSTEPTNEPTHKPTRSPTFLPTSAPWALPTAKPTKSPTFPRTAEPTPLPEPSAQPTLLPTHEPTLYPSPEPSAPPSYSPTRKPTVRPTHEPTTGPTHAPTYRPTVNPTREPSKEPSHEPSTPFPTRKPTYGPAHYPTLSPAPTAKPSDFHLSCGGSPCPGAS